MSGESHGDGVVEPTAAEIAQRAYSIWEANGRPHGHDVQHWLQAQVELLAERMFVQSCSGYQHSEEMSWCGQDETASELVPGSEAVFTGSRSTTADQPCGDDPDRPGWTGL